MPLEAQAQRIVVRDDRFNRLADARHDALNPRTAMREIPRGAMSRSEAAIFVIVSSAIFVYGASRLNTLC